MAAPFDDNPSHSRHRPQPRSLSTSRPASILNNAKNTQINDGVFTIDNSTTNYNAYSVLLEVLPLDLLYRSVAPNAILNTGGRADEVRCYPGTREEVIGLVEESISQEYTGPRMLWLSGPAGAGKSAIMQTAAERCRDQGVPHANFFFFRADSSRRDIGPFVATIVYQIMQHYPSLGPVVAAALASDPLLFRMGIQLQFDVLLHQVLATLHHASPSLPPLVLLIDGLDECDSETKTGQRHLLQALDALVIQAGPFLRVVIASRVEPQISMAFSQLRSEVDSIFLDEKYSPEQDIHRFIIAEFDKIKSSHYLASTLDPEWPSESDVAGIVSKSSGQFIFAATVMRAMLYSSISPILSLQKVQGIVPANKNSPFAHVDAVYAYILAQVEDWDATKLLLVIIILDGDFNHKILDIIMAYQPTFSRAVFDSCLAELSPIVCMDSSELRFFHASFPDFLQDKNRSREYYINLEAFCTGAFPIWWRNQSGLSVNSASFALERVKQPTSEISSALMGCTPRMEDLKCSLRLPEFVQGLYRLYAPRDLETFNKIMHIWASGDPEIAQYTTLRKFLPSTSQNHSSISDTSN